MDQGIANAVLREGSACRIHYSLFMDQGFPSNLEPSLPWGKVKITPLNHEDKVYTRSAEACWNFETFLPWIKLRSDDQLGWISFHSLSTDSIYSPYDEGADIFTTDDEFMSRIKGTFSDWKSKHPAGL